MVERLEEAGEGWLKPGGVSERWARLAEGGGSSIFLLSFRMEVRLTVEDVVAAAVKA